MGESLTAVWEQVSTLLQIGVSVIPVRDRTVEGKPPKTPYGGWKQYQSQIITPDDLWSMMEKHNTSAIAMICGKVSGNLEAIDIDVKNWPGIDARYFEAIRDLYPVIWENLRIHSTPSGGFHILYRIDRPGPGNQKLATASHSTQAGIETRGEGGYIVAPPSLGYQVYKDNPIPLLNWGQREALINLAKSLNEKVKQAPAPKLEKAKIEYYDEDPFTSFNHSPEGGRVLEDNGWMQCSTNHHYYYYTRPGKDAGISASYNVQGGYYFVFTSSTRLEPDTGYSPAGILVELQFNGSWKAAYAHLVERGYGRIKPQVEKRLIRARVLSGEDLPANASAQAKVIYLQTKTCLAETYPHGTYWVQDDTDDIVKINRERLYTVANALGFRHYNGSVVRIEGYIIRNVTARYFYDTLKAYCTEKEEDFLEAIRNAFEAFIQRAGDFSMSRICLLEEERILRSQRTVAYISYRNGCVKIASHNHEFITYEQLLTSLPGALIWEHKILQRDYHPLQEGQDVKQSLYYQFLDLAIGVSDYLWKVIGYLAHDYKDETMGHLIVLVEQCEDPKQGGGTGKNLFCNLLGHITSVKNIAGVQVQLNEKLLQSWNYERIMVISDVTKHFNFAFFKEPSMGHGIVKKLFKDEAVIPPHQMPKFIFSTNYSYESVDGGLKRRIRPIEFTPYFTKSGGVDKHFGLLFPYDWNEQEWAAFDYLLLKAIQYFISSDGKIEAAALSDTGWMKQFDQTYHFSTRSFILENWEYWLRTQFISNESFKLAYDTYCNAAGIHIRFRLTAYRLNQALEDWSSYHKVFYEKNFIQRGNGTSIRGKAFWSLEPAPF